MSGENVESRASVKERGSRTDVLVRYRVVGGPVGIDQRLTVFEDGAVELDERHRTRDSIWLRLEVTELDQVRAALDEIPARIWSAPPTLVLARAKRAVAAVLTTNEFKTLGTHFELRRRRQAITGERPGAYSQAIVTLLDALRARAVRAEPR